MALLGVLQEGLRRLVQVDLDVLGLAGRNHVLPRQLFFRLIPIPEPVLGVEGILIDRHGFVQGEAFLSPVRAKGVDEAAGYAMLRAEQPGPQRHLVGPHFAVLPGMNQPLTDELLR